ncbi:MAG: putative porin, partial [Ferruginibacter sp.]
KFKLEETKLYRTTRPFSMIGYQLAKGKEQMLQAGHTQNPKPNLNFGFDYRLISSPGLFINQNTNHNNFRIFSSYQGKRKRYNGTLVLVGNTIRASQNGGIQNDTLLDDPNRKDRFSVPVNLGNEGRYQINPFVTTVSTGITYKDFTFFLRQSYDLGKKDSFAINDSTTEYLFYPKLRLQHTLKFISNRNSYQDVRADSSIYKDWYNIDFPKAIDTFNLYERWDIVSNDFSILQFPDTKNSSQFFLAGATFQNIKSNIIGTGDFHNLIVHGEYRNKTKNKLWDVLINGEFYVTGFNNGDYKANAKLNRYLNKKLGNITLFFTNVNRTPSFIFDNRSVFNLNGETISKKENIISFGATSNNSFATLGFRNNLLNNYTYFSGYYNAEQSGKPINILQIWASKKIKLSKRFNLYSDATFQQSGINSPINIPLVYTRNRIAYEGTFYKNLNLSTGLEIKYYTPYKMNNYSPVIGQFMFQDTTTISNRPDVALFVDFRIKTFTAYIRAENLNTVSTLNGFGFTHNNFSAP